MSMNINSAISAYNTAANITRNFGDSSASEKTLNPQSSPFAELVANPLRSTTASLRSVESATLGNLSKQVDITDVVTAMTNAETTLKTVVAVRDRLVSAFQDLQKMPI